MNDLSENIYIKSRLNGLRSYNLHTFLYGDFAVQTRATLNDVRLAVANILIAHGFHIQLRGHKLLTSLVSRYIVKSNYDETEAITAMARTYGMPVEYIISCITGAICESKDFLLRARRSLHAEIKFDAQTAITDTVNIIGAAFVIYYNYVTDEEDFEEDSEPAINYYRMFVKDGER